MDAFVKPKKRGRPRKNIEKPISLQKKEDENENIVVFLALDETDDADNNFTTNDTDTARNTRQINSITDSSDAITQPKHFDPNALIAEIKKRDQIIANLRSKQGTHIKHSAQNPINYNYVSIADTTTGKKFAPHVTQIHCWWCDCQFDTIPVYIPTNYINNIFYVFGNFCSFNCAGKYNSMLLNDYKCYTRLALLNCLKYRLTGSAEPIKFAPSRELLTTKGGPLNIDEFRNNFVCISSDLLMSMPPIIPLVHSIEGAAL